MTTLGPDHVADLLIHQLGQHPTRADPDRQGHSPPFAAPASSPSASWTRPGRASNLLSPKFYKLRDNLRTAEAHAASALRKLSVGSRQALAGPEAARAMEASAVEGR